MRFRKTMLVERDYYKPAKMTININDNYLFANIEDKIMFVDNSSPRKLATLVMRDSV